MIYGSVNNVYRHASSINWKGLGLAYSYARDYLPHAKVEDMFTGRYQYRQIQRSLSAKMSYENYLKQGNERALADWHENLPGRTIRYPEFSYAGQIRRADTSIARAGIDYDTAYANYIGNLPYRGAGLYGIGGRLSRSL